jgi:peptidoglycan/LPS O-acetylase OafA/YrhL
MNIRTLSIIEKLVNWQMEKPSMFSLFHILFFISICIALFLLVYFFRNCSEKTMKIIVLVVWILLVFMEILKQIIRSNQTGVFDYKWDQFPLQFCETPLYVLPILLFNKNKKFQNVIISFLATYVMFAGMAIVTLPFTGFSKFVILNIRNMLGHGFQFMLGAFLFAWNRHNMNIKNFLYGGIIFLIVVAIAITFNSIVDPRVDEWVNMFFLNPNYPSELMIMKRIQPHVHWIIFDLLYIVFFSILAFTTLIVEYLVWQLCHLIEKKAKKN